MTKNVQSWTQIPREVKRNFQNAKKILSRRLERKINFGEHSPLMGLIRNRDQKNLRNKMKESLENSIPDISVEISDNKTMSAWKPQIC